ncbi:MAG: hypothetical protein ABSD56_08330 [Bryobacteraceae bacterium]
MLLRVFLAGLAAFASGAIAAPVQTSKQLAIVRPALREYEDGPAAAAENPFLTGETVFFSFQIAGYQVSPESKTDLRCRVEAADPAGILIVEPIGQDLATQVSPEDKNWMPVVRGSFLIPPLALAGAYRVRIAVEDRLSGQKTSAELALPVRGRRVEPSDTLVTRNFRFLRAEDDPEPLAPAVYHAGDSIWARFDITGFHYGEKNHVHVEYGIAMVTLSGRTLYSQPQAAIEDDATYYPKRYLAGALSLSLGQDFKPGEYVIVLTVRDQVGNQTAESRHAFRVE